MFTSNKIRCWLLGLACSIVPLAGCSHAPAHSSGGIFSWFRRTPLTEREQRRQELAEATEQLQDPANLHLKYGQWREHVGDLADARRSYQSALKENPKSLEAKLGLARLDQLAGLSKEAEAGFQEALKSRPDDPLALNALGQFYASQQQWSKALPLLEKAADAAPLDVTFRYHLAVAMARSGDMDGAFPHFSRALGEAEAHYNIGYLLYEKGHPELAKARFKMAVAANPQLQQAQAMLAEMEAERQKTLLAEAPQPRLPVARAVVPTAARQAPTTPRARPATPRTVPPVLPTASATRPAVPAAAPIASSAPSTVPPTHRAKPAHWQAVQRTPLPKHPHAGHQKPVQTAPNFPPQRPIQNVSHTAPQQPLPAATPVAATPPPSAPPAFRPTQKGRWAASGSSQPAADYLPPYRPTADAAPAAPAANALPTPPITPQQREQWENQVKANALN